MTTQRGKSDGPKRDIIFHSALADRGPVRITVDSEPRFLKNKDRDVVELTIGSDKVLYWSENEDCAKFFKGQSGRTFTIIAEGKKETATITYVGESIAQPGATAAPATPLPQRSTPPPAAAPAATQAPVRGDLPPAGNDWIDKFLSAKKHAGQYGVAIRLAAGQCLASAQAFCESNGVKLSEETKTAMVSNLAEGMCQRETMISILVGMERGGSVGKLPPVMTPEVLAKAMVRSAFRNTEAAAPAPPPQPPPAQPDTGDGLEDDRPY